MSELNEIGKKINKAIEAIWDIGLSEEDLSKFDRYIHSKNLLAH